MIQFQAQRQNHKPTEQHYSSIYFPIFITVHCSLQGHRSIRYFYFSSLFLVSYLFQNQRKGRLYIELTLGQESERTKASDFRKRDRTCRALARSSRGKTRFHSIVLEGNIGLDIHERTLSERCTWRWGNNFSFSVGGERLSEIQCMEKCLVLYIRFPMWNLSWNFFSCILYLFYFL